MNTPEKPITGQPPAPPVPQWLLDAASHFEQSYVRPRVSVRGLIYATWIAGWEAGIDAMTPTVVPPEDTDDVLMDTAFSGTDRS